MSTTGRTRVVAVLGDPIESARAPEALSRLVGVLGLDVVVVPIAVGRDDLDAFVAAVRIWRNLLGIVVTMPHKMAMTKHADVLSMRASASGTVNVVRRSLEGQLEGDQIDGLGFIRSLADAGLPISGSSVCLIGAGGVGRSIAFALAEAGVARISVVNRSAWRSHKLVQELHSAYRDVAVASGRACDAAAADLVVNATSVGSYSQPGVPISLAHIRAGSIVADVVASPVWTEFLRGAAARGAQTHTGVQMQEAQLRQILDYVGATSASKTGLKE